MQVKAGAHRRIARTILYLLGNVNSAANMVLKARNSSSKKRRPVRVVPLDTDGETPTFNQIRPGGIVHGVNTPRLDGAIAALYGGESGGQLEGPQSGDAWAMRQLLQSPLASARAHKSPFQNTCRCEIFIRLHAGCSSSKTREYASQR